MSFYNQYPNRKDWRKESREAKAVDPGCRNHGDCPHCQGNRLKYRRVADDRQREQMELAGL